MIEVKLHDIGEGMTEGEVLQYFVKPGDHIRADQPLVEVQTDKMTAEIPAPKDGVVEKILAEPGTVVTVGTTLLVIGNGSGEAGINGTSGTKPDEEKNNDPSIRIGRSTGEKRIVLASPYTRKIAREHGVSIEDIRGSGPAGRVTDEDVYDYIAAARKDSLAAVDVDTSAVKEPSTKAAASTAITESQTILPASAAETIPFRGRRKQIAKKMVQSMYTIPHATHFEEVDMTELLGFTKSLKEKGQKISVVAFFIKAVQLALKDFPIFNSKLDEANEVIKLEKSFHIGIATDTEDGLIVPVIRHVEQKTIKQIHKEMKELTEKAVFGKLTANDITGGTFTISNVGPFGSTGATPIINYPEVALLAFHQTKEKPVVRNSDIVIRSMMNVSMSFDHRVADGLTAVKFTNRLAELIENPKRMMLELI